MVRWRHQPDPDAGLTFTLVFTNDAPAPVELQRPDDAIQVHVLDARGRPVTIPTPPPAALINTRGKPGPHPNAPEILRLQPAGQHRAVVRIREARMSPGPGGIAPLPRGTYHVRVTVLLLAADRSLDREQSFRVLETDRFVIRFGE